MIKVTTLADLPLGRKRTHERHGLTKTPIHMRWVGLVGRCTQPTHTRYKYYGGRGITICDRWRFSLLAFLEDMGYPPTPKHEIDRIDNNKGYEPGNCHWVTHGENQLNRRPRSEWNFKK
jgi:hypothetical protein